MGKFIEVTLTEIYEVPDNWEIVQDEEGNMAIQIDDKEYLDFETTILHADVSDLSGDEEASWTACVDDETLGLLDEKGLKEIKSELDIFEIDEDDLDDFNEIEN